MTLAPTIAELCARLPAELDARVEGGAGVTVASITHDSRETEPGGMFACLRGDNVDGHEFVATAVAAGVGALLVDHHVDLPGGADEVAQLVVTDTRAALGPVAAAVYGDPSTALRVVGITGTNGKTTTAAMLASILRASGDQTSVYGTLTGIRTTPEAPELQQRLAASRAHGDLSVVMEVSSHALTYRRVDGTRFDAAVFTNLGRDHLDLHGSIEEYFAAKASLFDPRLTVLGVVNADDEHGRRLSAAAPIEIVEFTRAQASDEVVGPGALHFTWHGGNEPVRIDVPVGGAFNVMNALAAATTAAALGVGTEAIVVGLATLDPVPGRFERVTAVGGAPIDVVVDYAHTPDGLEEAIASAGASLDGRGRVIVVFGAGGDRDHDKRPTMGAVAARLADLVIVTSDNPRTEDPLVIIDDIVAGIASGDRSRVEIEPDRAAAIRLAVGRAQPGDLVVVAGKGHETTQTIGTDALPFDDRQVARQALVDRAAQAGENVR